MKLVAYPAKFEDDGDGRVLVTFRDLPGAATDGADQAEALHEAIDLLNSDLSFRMQYREDIPAPSKVKKGERLISPDADVALKVGLYAAMQEQGISGYELAKRLGVDHKEVQRILNPLHATKTARMVEALAAVGRRARVELTAA